MAKLRSPGSLSFSISRLIEEKSDDESKNAQTTKKEPVTKGAPFGPSIPGAGMLFGTRPLWNPTGNPFGAMPFFWPPGNLAPPRSRMGLNQDRRPTSGDQQAAAAFAAQMKMAYDICAQAAAGQAAAAVAAAVGLFPPPPMAQLSPATTTNSSSNSISSSNRCPKPNSKMSKQKPYCNSERTAAPVAALLQNSAPIKRRGRIPTSMQPTVNQEQAASETNSVGSVEISQTDRQPSTTLGKQKTFTCPQCGKVFNAHYNLTRHMPVHTGARPFICKVRV